MRTFLRHAYTGQYFHSLDGWTFDRDEAHDFGLIPPAVKFAKKLRIPGLELILDVGEEQEVRKTPFQVFWRRLTRSRHTQPVKRVGRKARRSVTPENEPVIHSPRLMELQWR